MTKNVTLYVARPLFLACGQLAKVAAIAVCGYILIRDFGSLPRIAKVIVVVFHPLPFVFVQLLLFRAFYYFQLFGSRKEIPFVENQRLLDDLIKIRAPFCLYLRNHSFEKGTAILTWSASPNREPRSHLGLVHLPVANNAFEAEVVSKIGIYVPVFAIDSPSDSSIGMAKRILVRDKDWFSDVDPLIERAGLIIVNHEAQTDGIEREFMAVQKHKAETRTLLFTTETAIVSLAPEFLRRVRWVQIKERNPMHKRLETPTVLPEVVEFAAALGTGQLSNDDLTPRDGRSD